MMMFESQFHVERVTVGGSNLMVHRGGDGPPLLMLHGFPETHVAWHRVAPLLADRFTLVIPDLPGYGDSIGPDGDSSTAHYSKRAMANTLVALMTTLGFSEFALVGHDRGARVAYRMALDHPARVTQVAILDVIPSLDMADRTTYDTARRMANWFFLALPAPIPERLIGADPRLYLSHIVDAWSGTDVIAPEALEQYARCMSNPRVVHAMCEDYRAGDRIDIEHDRVDRRSGRRIDCPMLILWAGGGLTASFADPLTVWRNWARDVRGHAIHGGHFMMEESPDQIVDALLRFLTQG